MKDEFHRITSSKVINHYDTVTMKKNNDFQPRKKVIMNENIR